VTHQKEEIKRRLSVLENRLGITNNPPRNETFYNEITRRIANIEDSIKNPPPEFTEKTLDEIIKKLEGFESQIGLTGNINPDAPIPKSIQESSFETNFITIEGIGNGIKRDNKNLRIKIPGATWISGGIYKDNSLIIGGQSHKADEDKDASTIIFILRKRRLSRLRLRAKLNRGLYQVKLRYGGPGFSAYYNGIDDEFEII